MGTYFENIPRPVPPCEVVSPLKQFPILLRFIQAPELFSAHAIATQQSKPFFRQKSATNNFESTSEFCHTGITGVINERDVVRAITITNTPYLQRTILSVFLMPFHRGQLKNPRAGNKHTSLILHGLFSPPEIVC